MNIITAAMSSGQRGRLYVTAVALSHKKHLAFVFSVNVCNRHSLPHQSTLRQIFIHSALIGCDENTTPRWTRQLIRCVEVRDFYICIFTGSTHTSHRQPPISTEYCMSTSAEMRNKWDNFLNKLNVSNSECYRLRRFKPCFNVFWM